MDHDRLDQFYTQDGIARRCIGHLLRHYPDIRSFVEPSAGAGAFTRPLRMRGLRVYAVDIEPRMSHIIKADFLEHEVPDLPRPIAVVGNPPFGFASSTAIRFFNRSAEFADIIAFIVPRSWSKASIHERLDKRFWLASSVRLPVKAFVYRGRPYAVPCIWQVWERRAEARTISDTPDIDDVLQYVDRADAEFAIIRVGGRAGQVRLDLDRCPEQSTYFVRGDIDLIRSLRTRFRRRALVTMKGSLSKREIAEQVSLYRTTESPAEPLANTKGSLD